MGRKPKNKGNNTKQFKKHKPTPSTSSARKRKREDSPDAISFSKQKKQRSNTGGVVSTEDAESVVYIRQRVPHRRLLLYTEQMLMKHNFGVSKSAEAPLVQIAQQQNELSVHFKEAHQAKRCVNLLTSLLPVNDPSTSANNANTITDYNVEIAPICTGDLVCLPPRLYTSMGMFGPLVICIKVSENLSFIDPNTLQVGEVSAYHYFSTKFKSLLNTTKNLIEFTVIDVEKVMKNNHKPVKNGAYELADVTVSKSNELGHSDAAVFSIKTHLGHILQPGDRVMGYDLKNANLNDEHLESSQYKHVIVPDAVLVRKVYDKPKRRYWFLKSGAVTGAASEEDYERFLDELEEDEEMRKQINLYKDPNYKKSEQETDMELDDAWKQVPHVKLEELLESMSLF